MFSNRAILKKMLLLAMLAALGALFFASAACAESITWEMNYTRLHFEWSGTWDKTAWWAYALWYLDMPDWCYLWAWYGLGWDQLSPLTTPPTGKIDVWLKDSPYCHGETDGQNVILPINKMQTLDITTSAWFYQTLYEGSDLTYNLCGSIFMFRANGSHYSDDHALTYYALIRYVGYFIYPWGESYMSLSSLTASYKNAVTNDRGRILSFMEAGYSYIYGTGTAFSNGSLTDLAVGYYMYNWSGHQDISCIATLVHALGSGNSISSAYLAAFGHGVDVNTARYTDPNDFYYYFYHFYWG